MKKFRIKSDTKDNGASIRDSAQSLSQQSLPQNSGSKFKQVNSLINRILEEYEGQDAIVDK